MVKAMSTELKDMGVPFFGTKSHLIDRGTTSSIRVEGGGTSRMSPGKKIQGHELVKLQRKMLDMLEDMCAG